MDSVTSKDTVRPGDTAAREDTAALADGEKPTDSTKPPDAGAAYRYREARIKALRGAFTCTLPVLAGFFVLGIAYGILMASRGYGLFWPGLVSLFVFAGSMQFVAVDMLAGGLAPVSLLAMTVTVNARHLFYGISMLEKYRGTGRMKAYLIFGLCDETFSILSTTEPPEGADRRWFMFFVTLLNHAYWVIGSATGGLLGAVLPFDTTGVDFSLTALFTVILLGQWQGAKDRLPTLSGIACAVFCRLVFGPERFLIPAMLLILLSLGLGRKALEKRQERG